MGFFDLIKNHLIVDKNNTYRLEYECDDGEKVYAPAMNSGSVGLGSERCKNGDGELVKCKVTLWGVVYKNKLCSKSNYVGLDGI